MHEMSLMGGVFDVIEDTLDQYQVRKVTQVKLKVGKLTNAEPEALQLAFEAYSKDTVCEGADLIVEVVPVKGRCRSCGYEFPVQEILFYCPKCQYSGIEVTAGEELLLESLEIE